MGWSLGGFEVTAPVVILGAISGITYGLLAIGLVLIYRSNRIINFAHGEIGAFGAAVLRLMVTAWGLPYWVAFPLAVGVGAGTGALTEVTVVRRLRAAPSVMSVVALLGLAQFLLFFSAATGGAADVSFAYPSPPWLPEFNVGPLRITSAFSGMLLLTPPLVVALTIFVRKSRFGLAIRAAAANPDTARLHGVFVGRMSTLSWAIGGAVAAFTAILVLPTQGFGTGQFFGPSLLLRALAVAVAARMQSLPVALGAGVAIGVAEQVLLWNVTSSGVVEAVLFVLIVATLLLRPGRVGRERERGSWAALQPWPPLHEALQQVWAIRHLAKLFGALALVGALLFPVVSTNSSAVVMTAIFAFGIVGLSVIVVTGLGGQLSLGQWALAGLGAAASHVVVRETGNFVLGLTTAGAAAALASLVIGLPALRIRGLMLTVSTLGFAVAGQLWLFQQSWMFGGITEPRKPIIGGVALDLGRTYYVFGLAILVLAVWLTRNVWNGGVGRQLRAVRDNEDGARAFTVRVTRVKLTGFVIAGFLAGLGGAVFGHALTRITPIAFPIAGSINVVAMTVLGGIGVIAGPLIGAFYIIGVPRFLPLDNAGLAASSLGWLLLILYFPGGLAQLLRPVRERVIAWLARRAQVDLDQEPAPGDEIPVAREAIRLPPARAVAASGDGVLLAATGLVKHFGGLTAVNHVDLEVRAGETLGLIGPNGAGKTTLFELVSGFTRADEGSVVFAGTDVSRSTPEARARLGLIRSFQDASLFPTMTVRETVELALERSAPTRYLPAIAGLRGAERRKEERAGELLAGMGLHAFRNKQIRELSTGTRRIAELACMVALEPTLLLLDEPSSGIAQRETEALGEVLVHLKASLGLTLVMIEHDIPLVMSLSDRIIAMESGRVLAAGTPDQIRTDPDVVDAYLGGDVRAIERSNVAGTTPRGSNNGRCRSFTRRNTRCSRPAGADDLCAQHRRLGRVPQSPPEGPANP